MDYPSAFHISAQTPIIPTVQSWKGFLVDQGKSIYTVKAFMADLELLAGYLPPDRTIGQITTKDLNNFLEWMTTARGVPCSPKTLSRRVTSIKAFFRWLHQSGRISVDPAEKVVQKSVISPLPEVLTREEQERALKVVDDLRSGSKPDPRPATLLRLLLDTGIKKRETLSIHYNHIDLDAPNGPILFVRYASPANRYKERKIDLTDQFVECYKEYLESYKPREVIFPWSPRRLEYLLEDIGNAAGLTKHLSFEMCRWTSALRDLQNGVDKDEIRIKLGISKIQWREIGLKLRKLAEQQASAAATKVVKP
ncbi:MAG TPA: tyrosine-type recombinase/integrase [Bellilinea sp.]|nr:tyrosine-type recombinase/integrase [Bellilinea sp.]